jgi:hypothetical protein
MEEREREGKQKNMMNNESSMVAAVCCLGVSVKLSAVF